MSRLRWPFGSVVTGQGWRWSSLPPSQLFSIAEQGARFFFGVGKSVVGSLALKPLLG